MMGNLWLSAMGAGMITVASHPGDHTLPMERARELVGYFFVAMALFGLFYLKYGVASRFLKVELHPGLGYLQSLGGSVFLLLGASGLLVHRETLVPQVQCGF